MLWLVPISAVLIQGLILTVALGGHVQVRLTVIWLVALIFLVIGNYLPKSIGLATKDHMLVESLFKLVIDEALCKRH